LLSGSCSRAFSKTCLASLKYSFAVSTSSSAYSFPISIRASALDVLNSMSSGFSFR